MGRVYKKRATTSGVMRIELRWMLDNGYFIEGEEKKGIMRWTDGSSLIAVAINTGERISLELFYTIEEQEVNYTINLVRSPSNLGKGKLLYFICPISGEKCRILYKAYGSQIFKSRGSYSYKLYYEIQTSSKNYLHTNRYFNLERRLEKLYSLRASTTYKGRETKRSLLIKKLEDKQKIADSFRWDVLSRLYK
jgi:hypothetical protein